MSKVRKSERYHSEVRLNGPEFGAMLRRIRESRHLSQPALAEKVQLPEGGSLSTLQHLEWGLRTPSAAIIDELVRVLRLSGEERARFERLAAKTLPPTQQHTLRTFEALEARERNFLNILKSIHAVLSTIR